VSPPSFELITSVPFAPFAHRLSLAFDTTAFYWLALQARYDLERAKPVVRAYRPLVD
jgi:plasmid maintenance system antidote protein VapI